MMVKILQSSQIRHRTKLTLTYNKVERLSGLTFDRSLGLGSKHKDVLRYSTPQGRPNLFVLY